MKKRWMSALLALCMVLSLFPMTVFAADDTAPEIVAWGCVKDAGEAKALGSALTTAKNGEAYTSDWVAETFFVVIKTNSMKTSKYEVEFACGNQKAVHDAMTFAGDYLILAGDFDADPNPGTHFLNPLKDNLADNPFTVTIRPEVQELTRAGEQPDLSIDGFSFEKWGGNFLSLCGDWELKDTLTLTVPLSIDMSSHSLTAPAGKPAVKAENGAVVEVSGAPTADVVPANLTLADGSAQWPAGGQADAYSAAIDGSVITITAENLRKHENAEGVEGYWVGVGLPQEDGVTYQYAWNFGEPDESVVYRDNTRTQTTNGKTYATFYFNSDTFDTDPGKTAYIAEKATRDGVDTYVTYTVKFAVDYAQTTPSVTDGVPTTDVVPANLTLADSSAQWPAGGQADAYSAAISGSVITIAAENLKKHENAEGVEGNWVGVGLPKTDGAVYAWGFGSSDGLADDAFRANPRTQTTGGKEYTTFYFASDDFETDAYIVEKVVDGGTTTLTRYTVTFDVSLFVNPISDVRVSIVKDKASFNALSDAAKAVVGDWDDSRSEADVIADTDFPWLVVEYKRAEAGDVQFFTQFGEDAPAAVSGEGSFTAGTANDNAVFAFALTRFTNADGAASGAYVYEDAAATRYGSYKVGVKLDGHDIVLSDAVTISDPIVLPTVSAASDTDIDTGDAFWAAQKPSTLMSGVTVAANGKVTGTLPYAEWDAFSSVEEYQSGNYLVLKVPQTNGDLKITSVKISPTLNPDNQDGIPAASFFDGDGFGLIVKKVDDALKASGLTLTFTYADRGAVNGVTRTIALDLYDLTLGAEGDVPVTEVTLDKTSATIAVGETVTLTATVVPPEATRPTVTWASSDETVATVDSGVVTGVAEGSAIITATADGVSASCAVTVTDSSVPVPTVTGFTVAPAQLTSDGGSVTVTLTGENLSDGIAIQADGLTAATTGTGTEQTAALTLPANTGTEAVVYTVQYSLDGTNFIGGETVTVAGVTAAQAPIVALAVNDTDLIFDSQLTAADVNSGITAEMDADTKTLAVSGTARYLDSLAGYAEGDTSGHYFVLTLGKPDSVSRVEIRNYAGIDVTDWTGAFDPVLGGNPHDLVLKLDDENGNKIANFQFAFDDEVYTIDLSGLTLEQPDLPVNIPGIGIADEGVLGKTPADLMSGVTAVKSNETASGVDAAYQVSGTLNHVSGWTEFSSVEEYQSGNFLALKVVKPAGMAVSSVKISDSLNPDNQDGIAASAFFSDGGGAYGLLVKKVDNALKASGLTLTFTYADGTEKVVKLDLSGLTLAAEYVPGPSFVPAPPTTTTTTTNEDGSVTTTVTNLATGMVTETTERPDGTVEVVETRRDGTVTRTVTNPDGSAVQKVTTSDQDVTITVTDSRGGVLALVELPARIPAPEIRFVDVPAGHWAEQAINDMAGLNIVNGIGGNRYDINGNMTRGALATVLSRMSHGQTGLTASFDDVAAGQWYTDGIAWAAQNGIVTGYSDRAFGPEDVITREQLAVMLCRYAKLLGMDTSASNTVLNTFRDGGSTHGWAAESVAWCVANGILQGKGGATLAPTATATRAEVAVMLQRFLDLMK